MNEEFSFMNEKIKEKPFYKKRWVQLLVGTIGLAVLFGTIACFVFTKMYAWVENKEEQETIQNIDIPQDSTEDSAGQEITGQEQTPVTETIMVENEVTLEDYGVLFAQFRGLAKEVKKSTVTVTALNSDVDWFNEAYESRGQATGLIIGDNGVELLILTKYCAIEACDGRKSLLHTATPR